MKNADHNNPANRSQEKSKNTTIPFPLSSWELVALAAAIIVLLSPILYFTRSGHRIVPQAAETPAFVGSSSCAKCHQAAFKKWQGSYHELAMSEATEETVLGNFDDVSFKDPYNGVTSHFFRKDKRFFVETEGSDGGLATYQIAYTFGAYPLQQYLIPFPGGRLQCLNIAWDARNGTWYRLPPYEIEGSDDWLHWTKGGQTWNGMCAECHSTRLRKGFNITSDTYDTTWFEINVGCEACHGPGSRHVKWADEPPMARTPLKNFGLEVKTDSLDSGEQIAICAPCHSRRFQLGDNKHDQGEVLDKLVPSLLEEGLYYPDGQILEEVYVYGSFTQSKMYRRNVRCSDCHDMHSLKLHKEGNQLCLQCHRADEYDRYEHHFHKREYEGKPSEGHLCVKCHMPGRRYMGIDYRPDHSLRIPRPDLSRSLATPNSCSAAGCHADKSLDWVTGYYEKWYGTARKPHYGEILAAGRNRQPGIETDLRKLTEDPLLPAIVRATALAQLRDFPGTETTETITRALQDDHPLLRYTAIHSLDHLDRTTRLKLIAPKLYDHVKAVRIEAAVSLASLPETDLRKDDRDQFRKALAEYRQAMLYNADFAPQRYNLGNLAAAQGDEDSALAYYEQAIAIDRQFFPAKVNLAMLYNRRGENEKAEKLLREVVRDQPRQYEVSYSLGLLLAEMGNYSEAAVYLGKAADGMGEYSRARYNQALALLKLQRWEDAEKALLQALDQDPGNREYFQTTINLYLHFRMTEKARILAEKILKAVPDQPDARELLRNLKQ